MVLRALVVALSRGAASIVVTLALCGQASADDVYLKNGRVIRNVETREQDGRLFVDQAGTELAFPLSLVERVEEKEVVGVSRPASRPAADPVTPVASAAPPREPSDRVRTSFEYGEVMPKRVRFNNGVDVVTFTLPPGIWTWSGDASRERATGQDNDPWGHMNPSIIMEGLDDLVLYSLAVWPFIYHPALDMSKDAIARTWLSFARTELREGPMHTRSAAREEMRRVGAGRYFTTTYQHLWKDSNYRQDGVFLLYFPRDYKDKYRFYIIQWFVTYAPEHGKVDLDLPGFDTVVRTFGTRPLR